MSEIIEQVATLYPEVGNQLATLPLHTAQCIGDVALTLTHDALHPKIETQEFGLSQQTIDFERTIHDPLEDGQQLDAEALLAAEAGRDTLSQVLHRGAQLLRTAHDVLREEGFAFGQPGLETEAQTLKREQTEHDAIYDRAFKTALNSASEAKKQQQPEVAVAQLEALLLLRYTARPATLQRAVSDNGERHSLRQAVAAGLAPELLEAFQTASHLYTDDKRNLSAAEWQSKNLLRVATGKELNDQFMPQGAIDTSYHTPQGTGEVADLLAVAAASPDRPAALEKFFASTRNYTMSEILRDHIDVTAEPGSIDSAEYWLNTVELLDSKVGAIFQSDKLFQCSDPKLVLETATNLDLPTWQTIDLLGQPVDADGTGKLTFNAATIQQTLALRAAHPESFVAIVNNTAPGRKRIAFDPEATHANLDKLAAAQLDVPALLEAAAQFPDITAFVAAYRSTITYLQALGLGERDFTRLFPESSHRQAAFESQINFLTAYQENQGEQQAELEKLAIVDEMTTAYVEAFSGISYPFESFRDVYRKPELAELPMLQRKIMEFDLPPALAAEMFKSWATYEQFILANRQPEMESGMIEPPSASNIKATAMDQAHALWHQVDALQTFVTQNSVPEMHEVISNFDIYNFSRHKSAELADQNRRWKAGEAVTTAVVESRADWNSFTGKQVKFADGQGEGVFFFEANSALDVSRRAVAIGRRERSLGREPAVKSFIIHAHGNPNSMLMGVNREVIDTSLYQQAAEQRTKIPSAEINDYRRHLGSNYQVILQSCSTAGETESNQNIAATIGSAHATKVTGSNVSITGLKIRSDGEVHFMTSEENGQVVVYDYAG